MSNKTIRIFAIFAMCYSVLLILFNTIAFIMHVGTFVTVINTVLGLFLFPLSLYNYKTRKKNSDNK